MKKINKHIKKTVDDFTLSEFLEHFLALSEESKKAILKHKELFPKPTKNKSGKVVNNEIKGGRRYHTPGSLPTCPYCKPIIDNFNEMMMLQTDVFGITGISIEALFSAIKITKATIIMMKNEEKNK